MCKEYMSGMLLWIFAVIISVLSVYGIVHGPTKSMTFPEQTAVDQAYMWKEQFNTPQKVEYYKSQIAEIDSKIQNASDPNKIKELKLQKMNLENKIYKQ